MKEEISKNIIKQLCNDFVDTICVDLEEYPDEIPYTLACINSLKQENDSLSPLSFLRNKTCHVYSFSKEGSS